MHRAIGLCFGFDLNAGTFPCLQRLLNQGDPEYNGYHDDAGLMFMNTDGLWYQIDPGPPSFASQAQLIFIAACDLDVSMQSFLGITNSTHRRWLIVPESPTEVTLTMGEFAWLSIAQYLTKGNNLQVAISKANHDLDVHPPWTDQLTKKIVPTVHWMAIGNNADEGAGMNF
jgi:hypothetical protein